MTRLQKLFEKVKNNPKQVRFEELDKLLQSYGFIRRQPRGGSSHYYYKKGKLNISIPFKQHHVKATYVEQALELIEINLKEEEK